MKQCTATLNISTRSVSYSHHDHESLVCLYIRLATNDPQGIWCHILLQKQHCHNSCVQRNYWRDIRQQWTWVSWTSTLTRFQMQYKCINSCAISILQVTSATLAPGRDKSVATTCCPASPVITFQKVAMELDQLEQQGIIKMVDGPIPWVSPVSIVINMLSVSVLTCSWLIKRVISTDHRWSDPQIESSNHVLQGSLRALCHTQSSISGVRKGVNSTKRPSRCLSSYSQGKRMPLFQRK